MRKGDYQSQAQAERYNKKRFAGGLSLVNSDEAKLTKYWIESKKTKSFVAADLGTGTGRIIKPLLSLGAKKIFAVDASGAMLGSLKRNYPTEVKSGTIKTILGTSDKTKIANSSVDVVTIFHLFKHLKDTKTTLIESQRILKRHGLIVFDVLNKHGIVSLNPETCYLTTKSEVIKELKDSGFEVIEIRYLHYLGETIYSLTYPWGSWLWHIIDKFLSTLNIPLSTKMMVFAQKK